MAENETTATCADIAVGRQQPLGPAGGEKQDGTGQHISRLGPVEEQRTANVKWERTTKTQPK